MASKTARKNAASQHDVTPERQAAAQEKREAQRAKREAARREAEEEAARQRAAQRDVARAAAARLDGLYRESRERRERQEVLVHHLAGFYEEIDKLAKGKTPFPVTDLVLEETNQVIRDAKAIVTADVYLDRVKEFVAAGDNPVYPDAVVALRTIRQALERAREPLAAREKHLKGRASEAYTIAAALTYVADTGELPTLWDLRQLGARGTLSTQWFTKTAGDYGTDRSGDFDRNRLERIPSLEAYFEDAEDGAGNA